MALQGSRVNPGRWDSDLDPTPCDRYNNAECTIHLRIFLEQINPAGGAQQGTAREWGTDASGTSGSGRGTARRIVRWSDTAWRRWCRRYQREVQAFWHGKFWLVARHRFSELDFDDRGVTYRPNVWCRLRLQIADSAASAHKSISDVRLHASEPFFRSDSAHYDNRDIQSGRSRHHSRTFRQRAHVHEVGHALGLPHASSTNATCTSSGSVGHTTCYCATAADCGNIMGAGERLRATDAAPWQRALEEHGAGARSNWEVMLRRHYPRTLDEVSRGQHVTSRPTRN